MHASGEAPEAIAVALIAAGAPPIKAIRALRTIGVSLPDGKTMVDAALPPHVREANDRLREFAVQVMNSLDDRDLSPTDGVADGGNASRAE